MKFFFPAILALVGTALAAPLDGRAESELAQQNFAGSGVYILSSVATGTVIDLAGSRKADGTAVAGWERHNGDNQKWQVAHAGNNEYLFLSVATGTYLTANQTPTNNLILTSGNLVSPTTKRARWTIKPATTAGSYVITSVADTGKVLDLKETNPKNGTPIIVYQATGNKNQQWRFIKA